VQASSTIALGIARSAAWGVARSAVWGGTAPPT